MSVFGHGQLRLYLLGLLSDGPRHGYDIIRDLEQRFSGLYSPSAGTVYPRLSKLEEDGLVERTDEGRKASYRLTDAGREEARLRADEIADLESSLDDSAARMAEEMRARVQSGTAGLRHEIDAQTSAHRNERSSHRHDGERTPPPFDIDALLGNLSRGSFPDGDAIAAAVRRWGFTGAPGRPFGEQAPRADDAASADKSPSEDDTPAPRPDPTATSGTTDSPADPTPTSAPAAASSEPPAEEVVVEAEVTSADGAGADVLEAEVVDEESPRTTSGRPGPESPLGGMPNADQVREVVTILQEAGARIQEVLRRPH